ncbi:aminoglycoside phosphotransferase family protein [Marmoricola sp. URHB0036]|uniref:aminoglycoside phosphotransferase family protein n=1 Tax=Marmoricola sp. URHB0036 TaxID=1298863 RepID=UPI000417ACCA|nr:aminoglycoside phosphotransferase family protein [Marmoricola sp. URHB0036]
MSTDGRAGIDAGLVSRLVADQFPQWADLSVVPVEVDGWDNRTYRLGSELSVRLPTADSYVPAVEKEQRWLPVLAPHLPLPVPQPVALGAPSADFPRPWSVRRWIEGTPVVAGIDEDLLALDLAEFLVALRGVDASSGPRAGAHSFFRGGPLAAYDEETRRCLARLELDDADVWDTAVASAWDGPDVWFHGDVAVGNLLAREGRLAAVIDFGTSGVGDPACDLVIAWTFFGDSARETFRSAVGLDEDTWARARGWALWKALLGLVDDPRSAGDLRTVERVIGEHRAGS